MRKTFRHFYTKCADIAAGMIGGLVIDLIIANVQSKPALQPYYQGPLQAYYLQRPAQQVYSGTRTVCLTHNRSGLAAHDQPSLHKLLAGDGNGVDGAVEEVVRTSAFGFS